MICIENIGSYIPANRESNLDRQSKFDIDEDFIIGKLGVEQVSRKSLDEETSDLCVKALENLKSKTSTSLADVDCRVGCTQNPDGGGIPHTSAIVHGKLDLPESCACFDISLGCSGYVYSLSIVKAFMQTNGFKTGLLFTADPYSKIIDPNDKNTVLLFGDAAAVTLLQESEDVDGAWIPRAFSFASKGKKWQALHNHNKYLVMNGRAVFNLTVTQVPVQIKHLLDAAGLSSHDVDLFLFHQGSKYMLEQLSMRMNLSAEKVPIDLAKQGNTVSSSIPLLLEKYLDSENLKTIVMSGFGVGLSWASCLLSRHSLGERNDRNKG
jgi:3-oxoacyl-[acyl-carrier-protein] synthase-3